MSTKAVLAVNGRCKGNFLLFVSLAKKVRGNIYLKPNQEAGDAFDADQHEAITQIPAPSKKLKGKMCRHG